MKDKEKQIEEMAKSDKDLMQLCKLLFENWDGTVINVAKTVLEHYQPKLPEDSVVLSREEKQEYENLVKLLIYDKPIKSRVYEFVKDTKYQASKETAEKYKGFIRELLTNGDDSITTYYGDVKYRLIREDDLQELAKQFGVEIKE